MKVATYNEKTKTVEGADEVYVPDYKGIGHAFFTHMKRNRNSIAQVEVDTGLKENFGSLLKRSIRTAIELKNRGIVSGDIISLCSINNMHNAVPFVAAQLIGAIMASLDPSMSILDTTHLIKQVNPKIIFVSENAEQLIEDSIKEAESDAKIVTFGNNNKYSNFIEFLEPTDDENAFRPYEVEDIKQTALILFSSGTTGLSKGICIAHYGLFYQGHAFSANGCIHDLTLSYASTYWISTVVVIMKSMLFGENRAIVPKFNPKEIWHIIDKYKVSFAFLAPSQAIHMLKAGRPENIDTTSLHDIIVGGGPLSIENNLALRDLLPGTNIHLIFGQSEASGLVTGFRPADRKDVFAFHEKPNSCGRPLPGFKYKIVDHETEKVLGPNERGELRYWANAQMNGYFNRDSSEAFDKNGWVRSGDVAYFDEDLCFFIVDRIKDMLKFQAFHIPPARIEGVLLQHHDVANAVVVGIPDEDDGDHALGLVVLRPDATVTANELVDFVAGILEDRYRLRAGVKILDSLPLTPSGKVKKLYLRNKIIAGEL